MTSSPRFWQKFGIGKQQRSTSTSTSNSDSISIHSSISFYHTDDGPVFDNPNYEKKVKRLSTSSLKHKHSSASLYLKSTNTNTEKLQRRASSVHPLKRHDQEQMLKFNTECTNEQKTTKLPTPSRKQSYNDITKSSPSKLKKTKSNQSLVSVSTTTSIGSGGGRSSMDGTSKQTNNSRIRQPSTRSNSSVSNKKKVVQNNSGEEDENKSYLTRSSSNGSTTSAAEKRSRRNTISRKRQTGDEDAAFSLLKDELEMEKSSALALKGQKEAIAKDLDYFCSMVDELTIEKEEIKRNYEEQVNQNKLLKKTIHDLEVRTLDVGFNNDTAPTIENLQQQLVQEQYVYYNNLQLKNNEISKLKVDLKQAQNQIQILRKTMQQLLKSEGRDSFDEDLDLNSDTYKADQTILDEKELLLKSSNFLQNQLTPEESVTMATTAEEDDYLSATSKDSSHSHKSRAQSTQYEFLKSTTTVSDDDFHHNLTKRRSEDFSKSFARRRKDQLEEILGDVDSQLTRAQQKMRPVSS